MAYQLSDLVTKVQNRIKDTGFSTTIIKDFINDTQRDIFNEYSLPFMQTTQSYTLTVGVSDITNGSGLPANFVQPIDILLTTSGRETILEYKDYQEINNLYPDATDTTAYANQLPQYWYKYGETIRVFPSPDSAYTTSLLYYKSPTALSADADVPEIPSEFEELLVVGASYRVFQVKDNYDKAGILENKYMELLQKLASRYSKTRGGHANQMRINRHALGVASY